MINTLIAEEIRFYEKTRQEVMEKIKELLKEYFENLFNQYEEIQDVSWVQYTPYFMDGDTPYFSVYTDMYDIYINDCRLEDHPSFNASLSELEKLYGNISNTLSCITNDLFGSMFGDHVKVTLHRDGKITQEHYDHD